MDLLNQNRFLDATRLFVENADKDNKMSLLNCYMSFIQAASSHGEADLHGALALIWQVEKKASASKSIEGKLIQASVDNDREKERIL